MGPRQHAGFTHDRPYGVQRTTVDPLAGFNHVATQYAGFKFFQRRSKIGVCQLFFAKRGLDRLTGGIDCRCALLLVSQCEGGAHVGFTGRFCSCIEIRVIGGLKIKRLFCSVFGHLHDQVDHRLHLLMGKGDSAEHFFLGQFIGFGLDHHHGVFGASNNQIQTLIRLGPEVIHIFNFWVQDIFTIDKTNAATGDWATEWRARKGQSRRGGDHRDDIGVIHQVVT